MSVRVGVVNTLHRFVRNAVQAAVADVAPDRAEAAAADTGHVCSPTP